MLRVKLRPQSVGACALGLSPCFVLGFTTIFVDFGADASALGIALVGYRVKLNVAGGVIVIVFGLFTAGILRLA